MLSNRISLGLAALLLVVSAGMSAYAQDHELVGLALFEPADIRPYDNWAEQKNGFFFAFDGLYWHISPPAKTSVGDPNLTPTVFVGPALNDAYVQTNSVDTSSPSIWNWGDRMELGYIEGHHGFMFSSLETLSQTYDVTYANASVNFNDPAFGPEGSHYLDTVLAPAIGAVPAIIGETPVTFARLHMQNKSRVEGAEALYVYRPSELPLGGELRLMLGGRYLELKDQFWVDTNGGNLTDSFWDTTTHNEIGGPEIGLRYYQPFGRCGISVDGRFTAGLNAQAAYQNGLLAAYLVSGENAAPQPTLMGAHHLRQFHALDRVLADRRAAGRSPHATHQHHRGQGRLHRHVREQRGTGRRPGRLHAAQHGDHAEPGWEHAAGLHPRPDPQRRHLFLRDLETTFSRS